MSDYICTKSLTLEKYDDDGFVTDDYINVSVGDIYHQVGGPLLIAASPAIRLENESGNWIEICPETLTEFFAEVRHRKGENK